DPDEYAAALRAAKTEMTVIARGTFAAKLTNIDLHRLWMQGASDNLPRLAHSVLASGRARLLPYPAQAKCALGRCAIAADQYRTTRSRTGVHYRVSGH